jgi:sugar/nucleoside kinase (ribokinase family)
VIDLMVVGDLNPDVIVWGAEIRPRFGQVEQLVDGVTITVGGSAGIMACGAARLGVEVGLCAVVGTDPLGEVVCRLAERRGVDLTRVRRAASPATGVSVILAEPDDRAILTATGTIDALVPTDLDNIPAGAAGWVHVASPFLVSSVRPRLAGFMERMRAGGATVSLDTNWDPSERWEVDDLLAHTDVLFPNAAEALAISGRPDEASAMAHLASRVGMVVLKRGAEGATVRWSGGEAWASARLEGHSFVDAIGAGDSFDAGFVAGRLHGLSPSDSLDLAVRVGTLSTRARGGVDGQPTPDEMTP